MQTWLLDNSIWIIGLIAFTFVAINETRAFMKRKELTLGGLINFLRSALNQGLGYVAVRLATAAFIALVISLVSFRQLWINDVFHVVFVTLLMADAVTKYFRDLFA